MVLPPIGGLGMVLPPIGGLGMVLPPIGGLGMVKPPLGGLDFRCKKQNLILITFIFIASLH